MQGISKDILQTMKYAAKSVVENSPRDKTFVGTVVKVLGDKQFIVRYDNADRKITTTNSLLLKVGDVVHVIHPLDDSTNKFLHEDVPMLGDIDISSGVISVDGLTGVVDLSNKYAGKLNEHQHSNKSTLDSLSTSVDGSLLFNGNEISADDGNPIGSVIFYLGNDIPTNYLLCDGRDLLIEDYKKLADHIYTQYGSYKHFDEDSSCAENYFALPDISVYGGLIKCIIKY